MHYTDEAEQHEKALQHIEDTRHTQWADGMYIMLEDLKHPRDLQDRGMALVESSLRNSRYNAGGDLFCMWTGDDKIGVFWNHAGYGSDLDEIKLTRAQALYIATGETDL